MITYSILTGHGSGICIYLSCIIRDKEKVLTVAAKNEEKCWTIS